jgi:hypothetical protein
MSRFDQIKSLVDSSKPYYYTYYIGLDTENLGPGTEFSFGGAFTQNMIIDSQPLPVGGSFIYRFLSQTSVSERWQVNVGDRIFIRARDGRATITRDVRTTPPYHVELPKEKHKFGGIVEKHPEKKESPKIPGVDIPLWDKRYDVEPITK